MLIIFYSSWNGLFSVKQISQIIIGLECSANGEMEYIHEPEHYPGIFMRCYVFIWYKVLLKLGEVVSLKIFSKGK